ncbi:beta-lactamase/transpeptidase-like protein [Paraphoma chrysanthemicola]|uniref:Beta-lactamase/transpeptidase-like protein n=1 Tax=Paraphoma chrysanthemicola TaxID=798071 RepID=A0A8K0VVQ2_9PLEO|nr:beta-lactamase/transpeptidase-like protein [Paraphoma chrysanthemicola]
MRSIASHVSVFTSCFFAAAIAACVPDFPEKLLADAAVLRHRSVVAALGEVEQTLSDLFVNTTRDGLSFAIVHASTPGSVYTFSNGTLKMNETDLPATSSNIITNDSIFRIMSVSKNIAMTTALVLTCLPKHHSCPGLTLHTPVRQLLSDFTLPEADWNDGGSEITLGMLASHTAGIPRESYSTGFNMVLSTGKADSVTIGAAWASATSEDVLEAIAKERLMFAPGQRAAYSNAGISILGSAVAAYYNNVTGSDLTWSQLATEQLLQPLGMIHSFFGPVPQSLESFIGVPGRENWADLIIGEGYNPAAGMWSSANDLAKYLHSIWLSPIPDLITRYQRRRSLKPVATLPDGKQHVGPGWEIQLLTLNTTANASLDSTKTYSIFGKSGDGGGWHSWIDVIPNLGYGIVVLSQEAGLDDYVGISPTAIRDTVHEILAPAFAEALASTMLQRFAGTYHMGEDTGLLTDQVSHNVINTTTYAVLEVEDQILYLRSLVVNGSSALEAVDRLSWTSDTGPRYFSTEQGVVLEPAEGAAENAEFGEGAQVWRLIFPGLETCDWFDFDGYKDIRGWPLSKVVLIERKGRVELRYPPFDVVVSRSR